MDFKNKIVKSFDRACPGLISKIIFILFLLLIGSMEMKNSAS